MVMTCESCHGEIDERTSIVFRPPGKGAQEKHLCMSCFEQMGQPEREQQ